LEGIRTARTDEQGRFELTDLAAYNFQLKVSGGGAYGAPSFRVEHPDFAPTTVHYHTIPFEVDVVMEPAASITGRVVFAPNDRPAGGIRVRCRHVRRMRIHSATTRTDAEGNYALNSLPPYLRFLWLSGTNVTPNGVAKLKKGLPDLEVTF
jgi:hypothetical protein